jgi:hypothetical protein
MKYLLGTLKTTQSTVMWVRTEGKATKHPNASSKEAVAKHITELNGEKR